MELYEGEGAKLAVLPCGKTDRMPISPYYDSEHYGSIRFYDNTSDPEALRFRQRAHVYSMRRGAVPRHLAA
jgi:hypothetical protein